MYPQQYQEFLDFLDSNPEYLHDMRVRLLTPELIALPEQFAQMVATITDLAERFAPFVETTDKRLTAIEEDRQRSRRTWPQSRKTMKEDVDTKGSRRYAEGRRRPTRKPSDATDRTS